MPTSPPNTPRRPASTWRETVESWVIAALAILLLGFEAQGYVIPTGSMGPTLMGRHKEVDCPQCGHRYQVNVSEGVEIARGTCEDCRYEARIGDEPVSSGDRVFVNKVPAMAGTGPGRWEIAVFKCPEDPDRPYIKRQVGLGGEVLRIEAGDVFVRPLGSTGSFRRPPRSWAQQRAMQRHVSDDSRRARALAGDPRWRRWTSADNGAWAEPAPGTYVPPAGAGGWSELRYRHVVAEPDQWAAIRAGAPLPRAPRPTLITDFASYNTDVPAGVDPALYPRPWLQPHWVGDLTLSARLEVARPSGVVRLGLVEGGVPHHAAIDLRTGLATLDRDGQPLGPPRPTGLDVPGGHEVCFANVDDRLTLCVDGRLPFGDGLPYDAGPSPPRPAAADLAPAAVAVLGADVRVSALKVGRDTYYTREPGRADVAALEFSRPGDLFDLLADPSRYAATVDPASTDHPINPGHSLMLGDNSPWSKDSRAWGLPDRLDPADPSRGWVRSDRQAWEVPESFLIGRAFVLYWPHGKPFGPDIRLSRDVRLPSRPYVERMKLLH